jgi:hypothetical protein
MKEGAGNAGMDGPDRRLPKRDIGRNRVMVSTAENVFCIFVKKCLAQFAFYSL